MREKNMWGKWGKWGTIPKNRIDKPKNATPLFINAWGTGGELKENMAKQTKTSYKKCAKCGYAYNPCTIRRCPYSKKGAWVCVYCCKRCPRVTKIGTGFGCSLFKPKEESS